jgi:nitrite reductase (NADH) small subunit
MDRTSLWAKLLTLLGGARIGRAREETGDKPMSRFVKLATLDELPVGSAKEVEFEGRIYAIFNRDGVISAIDGICPHQGGPLAEGHIEGTIVTCPWHGWQFDVQSGKTPMGP